MAPFSRAAACVSISGAIRTEKRRRRSTLGRGMIALKGKIDDLAPNRGSRGCRLRVCFSGIDPMWGLAPLGWRPSVDPGWNWYWLAFGTQRTRFATAQPADPTQMHRVQTWATAVSNLTADTTGDMAVTGELMFGITHREV